MLFNITINKSTDHKYDGYTSPPNIPISPVRTDVTRRKFLEIVYNARACNQLVTCVTLSKNSAEGNELSYQLGLILSDWSSKSHTKFSYYTKIYFI